MRLLGDFLKESGIIDIEEIIQKFYILRDELKNYNEKVNLTAITSDDEIEIKHFIDSLMIIKCGLLNRGALLDIGSGAGFPALPIAIVYPELDVNVCESVSKKADFILRMIKIIDLKNVKVYSQRSEELPIELRESFDFVTARAVSKPIPTFELMFPWVKVGGRCFLYASTDVVCDEKITKTVSLLGGANIKDYDYELSSSDGKILKRKIITAIKTGSTPHTYPRRPGMANKKPLV